MTELVEMMFNSLRTYAGTPSSNDVKLIRIVFRQNSVLLEFCNELVDLIERIETNLVAMVRQAKFFDSLLKRITSVIIIALLIISFKHLSFD